MELERFAGLRWIRSLQTIWGCSVRCLWGRRGCALSCILFAHARKNKIDLRVLIVTPPALSVLALRCGDL